MCAQTSSVWLQTRASLLDRLGGDVREQDWEEFYEMYWRVIYGYGRGWGLSPDDAEDLVQDVMVTVLRKLPAFEYDRSRGRFLSWIKTITRRKVIDLRRRNAVRPAGAGETTVNDIPDPASPADDARWQRQWEDAVMALALARVAKRVDTKTMNAFQQYVLEDRSPKDVAEEMGLSVSAVYVIKNRMIASIREEVRQIESETE